MCEPLVIHTELDEARLIQTEHLMRKTCFFESVFIVVYLKEKKKNIVYIQITSNQDLGENDCELAKILIHVNQHGPRKDLKLNIPYCYLSLMFARVA